jgi:hypothetical protein
MQTYIRHVIVYAWYMLHLCSHSLLEGTFFELMKSYLHNSDDMSQVESYVQIAKDEGGVVECGGERPDLGSEELANGNYYLPTVISGLPSTARAAIEEIFGPVCTIHPFDTEEEVRLCFCICVSTYLCIYVYLYQCT